METEIKDIVFKKDVNVKHKHISIYNNFMCISENLLHEIGFDNISHDGDIVSVDHYVTYNYGKDKCYIYLRRNTDGDYTVCGTNNVDMFFDIIEDNNKENLISLRIQQKVHKKIVQLYLESKLSRIEKLKKLMDKI